MLKVNKEEWIEVSILKSKIDEWKDKGYSIDDVINTLVLRDYKLNGKLVSIKKLISLWNSKEVEL